MQLGKAYADTRMRGGNKYLARKAVYKGTLYHSAKEAAQAAELDVKKRAGLIKEWRRQVHYPLKIGAQKVCTIIVDFEEEYPDGTKRVIEVKGYPTPEWRVKWKMFEALYPQLEKVVV